MHQTDNFDTDGRVEGQQAKTSSLAQFPRVFYFSVTEHLNLKAKCGVLRLSYRFFFWKFPPVIIVGWNNHLTLQVVILKDSNPVAHSVDSDIFYPVIHLPSRFRT